MKPSLWKDPFTRETTPKLYKSGLVFSNFEPNYFSYCVLKHGNDETKDFGLWVQPFKNELWVFLLLIMSMYSIYSQFGLRDNNMFPTEVCVSVFKFIEITMGNGKIHNAGFQLCLAFLGVFKGTL